MNKYYVKDYPFDQNRLEKRWIYFGIIQLIDISILQIINTCLQMQQEHSSSYLQKKDIESCRQLMLQSSNENLSEYMLKFLKKPADISQIQSLITKYQNQLRTEVFKLYQMFETQQAKLQGIHQIKDLKPNQLQLAINNIKMATQKQQKKVKELIQNYQYQSNKLKHIIQFQQKCLRIKYSERPKQFRELLVNRLVCPYSDLNKVQLVCVNQKCNKHAFICAQCSCRCNQQHKNCKIVLADRFIKQFSQKLNKSQNINSVQYCEAKYLIYQHMSERISEQIYILKTHYQNKQKKVDDIFIYGYDKKACSIRCSHEEIWRQSQITQQMHKICKCIPIKIGQLKQEEFEQVKKGYDMLLDRVISFMGDVQTLKDASSFNAADRIILGVIGNQQRYLNKAELISNPTITASVIKASLSLPDGQIIGSKRSYLKKLRIFWVEQILPMFERLVSIKTNLFRSFIQRSLNQDYEYQTIKKIMANVSDEILLQRLENINRSLKKFEDQIFQNKVPLDKWKYKSIVQNLYKLFGDYIFSKNLIFNEKGDKRFEIVISKQGLQTQSSLQNMHLELRQSREKQNLYQSIYITHCKGYVTAIRLYHFPILQKDNQGSQFVASLYKIFPDIQYFYYFSDTNKMFEQVALNKQFIDSKNFDQFLGLEQSCQLIKFPKLKNINLYSNIKGQGQFCLTNKKDAHIRIINQNLQIIDTKMRSLHLINMHDPNKMKNMIKNIRFDNIFLEQCKGINNQNIQTIVNNSPNLKRLVLKKAPWFNGEKLKNIHSLNTLSIEQAQIQEVWGHVLIKNSKNLQFLHLSRIKEKRQNWISNTILTQIANNCSGLKYLNIRQNRITPTGIWQLRHLKNLKTLICGRGNQNNNQNNTYEGPEILRLTECLTNLERLSMDFLKVTSQQLLIMDTNIYLTHLNVKGCAELQADQLVKMTNLRYVVMWPPLSLLKRACNAANMLRQKGVLVCQTQ